jgi:hypothetical protein
MTQPHQDLQYLLDRAAIHDLHVRYYQGIDLGSEQQVRSCFSEDVQAHYHGRAPVRGLDALIESIPAFAKQASGDWTMCTHFMGNLNFKSVDRDTAETEVNAFAFLVLTSGPGDQVAMRSLRYLDRLVRARDGWRISERLHTLDWSCDVPPSFSTTFAQRRNVRPPRMAGT